MIKASNNRNYLKNRIFNQVINVIIAIIIAFSIRMFVFPSLRVKSNSMAPIIEFNNKVSDHIIINKIIYFFKKPVNGNIIAYKTPLCENDFAMIKAVPGDKLHCKKNILYVNGDKLQVNDTKEVMAIQDNLNWTSKKPFIIPENNYLIVRLNDETSSNTITYELIVKSNIIGKVIFIYWPINRIKKIIS